MSTRPEECGYCGEDHGPGGSCDELDGPGFVTVVVTVAFTVRVPEGTDPDDLCLAIDTGSVGVETVVGVPVASASVAEYGTVDCRVEPAGES